MLRNSTGCVLGVSKISIPGKPTQLEDIISQGGVHRGCQPTIAIVDERKTILRPFTPRVSLFLVLLLVDLPPPA